MESKTKPQMDDLMSATEIRPRPVAEFQWPTMERVAAGEEETRIAQRTVAQLPWANNV